MEIEMNAKVFTDRFNAFMLNKLISFKKYITDRKHLNNRDGYGHFIV